jgi:reverse transcriptase-like protein
MRADQCTEMQPPQRCRFFCLATSDFIGSILTRPQLCRESTIRTDCSRTKRLAGILGHSELTDLADVFDLANLRRAYRWIMSNPDARYKSYFRDSYDAFAIASDTQLRWIRQEGLKDRYQVSHASKILLPKASGTLRPFTLLTVEDQIVYQACINLIAEALKRKTGRRYESRVFAHLYAGKSSQFFYRQWQTSYRKFGQRIRDAHAKGFEYVANFDLAAFYDSIDHHVLRHFLKELGIDEDTIGFLLECLKTWTSTTWSNGPQNIYHEHGIPQGPLSSGMLSEAVLLHLDEAGEQGSKTIYLRYVDDIKILAKTEDELRRKLIKLDITSKEIGLFPQTSKINIRKIVDPNDEIKSVSGPPEPALKNRFKPDQKNLCVRLLSLSRGGKVTPSDITRFKFLLANATPTHRLNSRMMTVLTSHPELARAICLYFARYKRIPTKLAFEILSHLSGVELYHSVSGELLKACLGRFPPRESAQLGKFCADRLVRPKKGSLPLQPTYKASLVNWGLAERTLSFAEYEKIAFNELDWWVKKSSLSELRSSLFGPPTYADLLNRFSRASESEVSRIAASRLLQEGIKLITPYGNVEGSAKRILKAAGAIRAVGQPASRINDILAYILSRAHTEYDWPKFFGKGHRHAELMVIFLKRNKESNIDAFLVQLDSYCDLLTAEIWKRLKPTKTYPNFGHAIKDPLLKATLPKMMSVFLLLHDLRLQSTTAHPRSLKTGMPTRRLKHRDFYNIRRDLIRAFDEFESTMAP